MLLRFIYSDGQGARSERLLTQWNENSRYIQGRSEENGLPKTYRKDRIVEFLEGEELLLGDAAPLAPAPTPKTQSDQRAQILFTGFLKAERAELEALAAAHWLRVMSGPGKLLAFLCCGLTAGPTKISKAQEAGAFILDSAGLRHLLDTGEIPDANAPTT